VFTRSPRAPNSSASALPRFDSAALAADWATKPPANPAERLATTWAPALNGVGPADLTVAYYAHHLRPVAEQGADNLDLVDEEVARLVLALGAQDELARGPATMPLRYLAD
jgi:hypothetical protein